MTLKHAKGIAIGLMGSVLVFIFVAIALLFSHFATAATSGLEVTYVPKDVVAEDKYVPVGLILPGNKAPKQVQAHMVALEQELAPHLIPTPVGYNKEHWAKCMVEVLQDPVSRKNKDPEPYYRIECWSAPLWKGDKGLYPAISVPKTPIEAAVILAHFSRLHFARVGESATKQVVHQRTLGT